MSASIRPAGRRRANLPGDSAASPLLYDEGVCRRFLMEVSAGRVHFGSDFPLKVYPKIDDAANRSRPVAEAHRSGLGAAQPRALRRESSAALLSR